MSTSRSTFAALTSLITRPIDRNPFTAFAIVACALLTACGGFDIFKGKAPDPRDGKPRTSAELESRGRAAIRNIEEERDDALAQARSLIEEAKRRDTDIAAVAHDYAEAIEQADAKTAEIRALVEGVANVASIGLGPFGTIIPGALALAFAVDNQRKDRLIRAYRKPAHEPTRTA